MCSLVLALRVVQTAVGGALNVLVLALGLGSLAVILMAQQRVQQALERDVAGIDVVVGAKGSPLQLILAGVYHLDVPPGNIALADVEALRATRRWRSSSPSAWATTWLVFASWAPRPTTRHCTAGKLASGHWWQAPMQAVLGAEVARDHGFAGG
jgi:putative ABC transport system permease protein